MCWETCFKLKPKNFFFQPLTPHCTNVQPLKQQPGTYQSVRTEKIKRVVEESKVVVGEDLKEDGLVEVIYDEVLFGRYGVKEGIRCRGRWL